MPDYNYGEDYGEEARREEEDFPSSTIEWFDARTRHKRDTEQSIENEVHYEVCVRSVLEISIPLVLRLPLQVKLATSSNVNSEDLQGMSSSSNRVLTNILYPKTRGGRPYIVL